MPPLSRITTSRLVLIPFDPNLDTHCDFVVTLYHSPEALAANASVRTSVPDRDTTRRRLVEAQVKQLINGFGRVIIAVKPTAKEEGEGEFIGTVGLKRRQTPGAPSVPDIGFAFLRPFWGKGYATEATRALLNYFEHERGVKDVLGFCHPENENSKNMFRRLGFEDRGVRSLKGLADEGKVVQGQVWATEGMSEDLGVYGL